MPHVVYTCLLNSYKDSLRTPPFAFKFDKVHMRRTKKAVFWNSRRFVGMLRNEFLRGQVIFIYKCLLFL